MRVAYRMRIDPGHEAEYIRRHNPIWPQLKVTLKAQGVHTYSIYLDRRAGCSRTLRSRIWRVGRRSPTPKSAANGGPTCVR